MLAIYSFGEFNLDLEFVDHERIKKFELNQLEEFISTSADYKIAAIEMDYTLDPNINDSKKLISRLQLFCDLVIVKSMELNDFLNSIIFSCDYKNIVYIVSGKILNHNLSNATILDDNTWFNSTTSNYLYEWQDCIKELKPFAEKQFVFDILYGQVKDRSNRVFIKDKVKNSEFSTQFLISDSTYYQGGNNYPSLGNLFWEDGIDNSTVPPPKCVFRNKIINLSQVLPVKIYNQSCASVVMETYWSSDFIFPTEKTVKCMLALRLFVIFAGKGYLEYLRSLGFKTFHGIIDESYDSVEDDTLRWNLAWQQVELLSGLPQQQWLSKIHNIVLHNYYLLKNLHSEKVNQTVQEFIVSKGYYCG